MFNRIIIFFLLVLLNQPTLAKPTPVEASYDFDFISNQWITMPDGVNLAVSYWKPKPKVRGERFPIVLEALPYRKDDNHYTSDYPLYAYLARRGIASARVDNRGTGSSEGIAPDREYSSQELADTAVIIDKLAALPWSNENIGMQGISWSAFNSIMLAMQRPKYLKGLLIAHGSDDLYANDIHNIDGALHIDIFTIEIDIDNLLPRSPNYPIDETYFKERFNQEPWIFTYLRHQRDGSFWQDNRSLQTDYSKINIPVYAVSSLLDGYRDFATNMLEKVKVPIKVTIGPQNHEWPNDTPGPEYEWRQLAARWWQQILNGKDTGIWDEPNLLVFMRDYVPPDINLQQTPGVYRSMQGPIKNTNWLHLNLQTKGLLDATKNSASINTLNYKASGGKAVLNWWGETTPDMKEADEDALIYDTNPLTDDISILGNAEVTLKVAADVPLAHWIARLEDVSPDGKVSLITGALRNGAQRLSRVNPTAIPHDEFFELKFPLHFTTWKFLKGHKIRLVITNAQFPLAWPTPYVMRTKLVIGNGESFLNLPIFKVTNQIIPVLPGHEPSEASPDATDINLTDLTPFETRRDDKGNFFASAKEGYVASIHGHVYDVNYFVVYRVNDNNPADASFTGTGVDTVKLPEQNRTIRIKSVIQIDSDEKYFHTTVTREISENGNSLKTRTWHEDILRDFE